MSNNNSFNPGTAAVLSLIIPGLGQIYKGQIANGIIWGVFVVAGYLMLIIPGIILHIACVKGAYSGSAKQKHCPYCGESILESAIKCKHCGSDLNGGKK